MKTITIRCERCYHESVYVEGEPWPAGERLFFGVSVKVDKIGGGHFSDDSPTWAKGEGPQQHWCSVCVEQAGILDEGMITPLSQIAREGSE